jgi:flagellar biosynthesis/type III secretory pathway protein FliH
MVYLEHFLTPSSEKSPTASQEDFEAASHLLEAREVLKVARERAELMISQAVAKSTLLKAKRRERLRKYRSLYHKTLNATLKSKFEIQLHHAKIECLLRSKQALPIIAEKLLLKILDKKPEIEANWLLNQVTALVTTSSAISSSQLRIEYPIKINKLLKQALITLSSTVKIELIPNNSLKNNTIGIVSDSGKIEISLRRAVKNLSEGLVLS